MNVKGSYLITGTSGSGKSTAARILQERGYNAVNADEGYCQFVDLQGKPVPIESADIESEDWTARHRWVFVDKMIRELLEEHQGNHLFICATTDNESDYYELFDKVFWLHLEIKTALERIENPREHAYGKADHHKADLIASLPKADIRMQKAGATFINAEQSPDKVVDEILKHASNDSK